MMIRGACGMAIITIMIATSPPYDYNRHVVSHAHACDYSHPNTDALAIALPGGNF